MTTAPKEHRAKDRPSAGRRRARVTGCNSAASIAGISPGTLERNLIAVGSRLRRRARARMATLWTLNGQSWPNGQNFGLDSLPRLVRADSPKSRRTLKRRGNWGKG